MALQVGDRGTGVFIADFVPPKGTPFTLDIQPDITLQELAILLAWLANGRRLTVFLSDMDREKLKPVERHLVAQS
ncbi:MAG: hypothetical protein K1Y36_10440 [Blastocatellia bacterium]|nr:hypothetical protein [Blastocatellia bacterium]